MKLSLLRSKLRNSPVENLLPILSLTSQIGADEELTRGCAIHDEALPKYARQLALHMNVSSNEEFETLENARFSTLRNLIAAEGSRRLRLGGFPIPDRIHHSSKR